MRDRVLLIALLLTIWATAVASQVNLLVVVDEDDNRARDSVEAAVKYLEGSSMASVNTKFEVLLSPDMPTKTLQDVCGVMESMIDSGSPPDLVLDLSLGGESSEMIKSIAFNLGLPTVSSTMGGQNDIRKWRSLRPEQEDYLLQLNSALEVKLKEISDRHLAALTDANTAAVYYDDTFTFDRNFHKIFFNMKVRHLYRKIDPQTIEFELEDLITRKGIKTIFLLARPETVREVLSVADSRLWHGERLSWVAGSLSQGDMTGGCCGNMRLLQFNPRDSAIQDLREKFTFDDEPTIQSVFYADLASRAIATVEEMKKGGSWPSLDYVKCNAYSGDPIIRNLKMKSALMNSKLDGNTLSLSTNGLSHFMFPVDIKMHNPGQLEMEVGTWSAGPWTAGDPHNINFKSGMENALMIHPKRKKYKIVTVHQPPFMYYNEETDSFEGFTYDLIEEIKDILGFEYELSLATDGVYGRSADAGGNWVGMMGDLANDRADIGIGAVHVDGERYAVVDFTTPFYQPVGWSVMMKREKPSRDLFMFIWIMQDMVWGVIFIIFFSIITLMWFFNLISPFSYRNNMEAMKDDPEIRYFTFKESVYFGFMSITPQGGGLVPKSLGAKWVAASWWMFCFITVASYAANYGAQLTIARMVQRKERFDQLNQQTKIHWAPLNDSDPWNHFRIMFGVEERLYESWKEMAITSDVSTYERSKLAVWNYPVSTFFMKLWSEMGKQATWDIPLDMEDAIFRIKNGSRKGGNQFALLGDSTDIKYMEMTDCDLLETDEKQYWARPLAFAVPKGKQQLKEDLNRAILQLASMKRLDILKDKWWRLNPYKEECDGEKDGGKLDLWNIGGVFIMVGIGVAISLLLLILETLYFKFKEKKDASKVERITVSESVKGK